MMRSILLACLLCAAARAGVVQGSVQEQASGLSLSRTIVRLVPVPRADNVDLRTLQQRTGPAGQFVFFNIPDGYYFLIAVREGYFPGAYGQRRPNGQGTPILVTKDSDLFAQLRMRRKGAITGRVLDENGVGVEGVPVIAYRARQPLRVVAKAVSDDRGVYRIHGLEAGKYWVRSTAHTLEDGSGMLPTFGPQSREVRDAKAHDVRLDEDTPDADIHAEFGKLFSLTGTADCVEGQAKVTLSSESIRKTTQVPCGEKYTFVSLSPAVYEISAVTLDNTESGFFEAFFDKPRDATVKLAPMSTVEFVARRPGNSSFVPVVVTGRRQDLYDSDAEQQLPLRTTLMAGRWEISAQAGPDQYIESINNGNGMRRNNLLEQSIEWFEILVEIQRPQQVRIVVSGPAGRIAGAVTKDTKGVPGAAVFLWPISETIRRSLRGYRMAIADTEGKYHFDGLPPGDYRLLATFDFTEVDEAALDEGQAIVVHAAESQRTTADIPLWIAP